MFYFFGFGTFTPVFYKRVGKYIFKKSTRSVAKTPWCQKLVISVFTGTFKIKFVSKWKLVQVDDAAGLISESFHN